MALVRFSNLVNDIRGSTGGNTFSRGLAGATVSMKKTASTGVNSLFGKRPSPISQFARSWRQLSEFNRKSWQDLASSTTSKNRLGLHRSATGFELYVQRNAFLNRVGLTLLDTAPPISGVAFRPIKSVRFQESLDGSFVSTSVIFESGGVPVSFLANVLPASVSNITKANSSKTVLLGSTIDDPFSSESFTAPFNAAGYNDSYFVGQYGLFDLLFFNPLTGERKPLLRLTTQITKAT